MGKNGTCSRGYINSHSLVIVSGLYSFIFSFLQHKNENENLLPPNKGSVQRSLKRRKSSFLRNRTFIKTFKMERKTSFFHLK